MAKHRSVTSAILAILLVTASAAAAAEILPDKNLTGGSVRTGDAAIACHSGATKESRGRLTHARRDEVLRRYGLPPGMHPDYEIDHLIPLCAGGSDDASNLWPQPRSTVENKWNAEAKDRLEHRLCRMICSGAIEIGVAQEAFATDWIAAYLIYFEKPH